MSWHSLPLFMRVAGTPVILIGDGEAAAAKRRLLERAGVIVVGEAAEARLAIVAHANPDVVVERLKARGILVNVVDRPDLCDFTLPAVVDRAPVLVAIGTGGVSAGLAAALRQRFEAILPASLGGLADSLYAARAAIRTRYPEAADRRRAIASSLVAGAPLDPFLANGDTVARWLDGAPAESGDALTTICLKSPDPDDLTLRQVRALANADRVFHTPDVPAPILDRARADAPRIVCAAPPVEPGPGLTVFMEMS